MLASLAENLMSSGDEPAQVMEALEQRMLALEEQTDDDFEMVQLGLAVAIINHEFAASIKRVRASVRELGQISRKADALRPLYESIRANFDHLDGHLNLFTPLQRRLHRTAQTISGKSIRNYVTDLFANRFARHGVSLECTESFLGSTVDCYPSTLYPAFINLVDNAVFWLTNRTTGRAVLFDATSSGMIVANNGPAIDERDYHRIFERGFSRKPGGRGLGLFISARALQSERMNLSVVPAPSGFNAAFSISMPTLKLKP
jgi:signal transduction histidine kinase